MEARAGAAWRRERAARQLRGGAASRRSATCSRRRTAIPVSSSLRRLRCAPCATSSSCRCCANRRCSENWCAACRSSTTAIAPARCRSISTRAAGAAERGFSRRSVPTWCLPRAATARRTACSRCFRRGARLPSSGSSLPIVIEHPHWRLHCNGWISRPMRSPKPTGAAAGLRVRSFAIGTATSPGSMASPDRLSASSVRMATSGCFSGQSDPADSSWLARLYPAGAVKAAFAGLGADDRVPAPSHQVVERLDRQRTGGFHDVGRRHPDAGRITWALVDVRAFAQCPSAAPMSAETIATTKRLRMLSLHVPAARASGALAIREGYAGPAPGRVKKLTRKERFPEGAPALSQPAACPRRIGPAQLRRQDHGDLTADGMAGTGPSSTASSRPPRTLSS